MIKPRDILKWSKVSEALSGNNNGVRASYLKGGNKLNKKIYYELVKELLDFIDNWLKKVEEFKNNKINVQ